MKKKILALLMSSIIACGLLVGCGSTDPNQGVTCACTINMTTSTNPYEETSNNGPIDLVLESIGDKIHISIKGSGISLDGVSGMGKQTALHVYIDNEYVYINQNGTNGTWQKAPIDNSEAFNGFMSAMNTFFGFVRTINNVPFVEPEELINNENIQVAIDDCFEITIPSQSANAKKIELSQLTAIFDLLSSQVQEIK